MHFHCLTYYLLELIQSNCGLSEGSTEWDLCDQQNCSAWCQAALMTFIRMLSNKIMQCAMKVVCILFNKDSLFYAVARHVSLTLMPYKYHWYIKLVLHCRIFIISELVSGAFISRGNGRKDEKGSASFFFFSFFFGVGCWWVLFISLRALCVDSLLCTWEACGARNNCSFHGKKGHIN